LKQLKIPAGVCEIGNCACAACLSLEFADFAPNSELCLISGRMFDECRKLRRLEIPAGVCELDYGACCECVGLKSVSFPPESKLGTIRAFSFSGCGNLTRFRIPAGVTSVPGGAETFRGVKFLRAPNRLREALQDAARFGISVEFF
jgi:hypothetical protein